MYRVFINRFMYSNPNATEELKPILNTMDTNGFGSGNLMDPPLRKAMALLINCMAFPSAYLVEKRSSAVRRPPAKCKNRLKPRYENRNEISSVHQNGSRRIVREFREPYGRTRRRPAVHRDPEFWRCDIGEFRVFAYSDGHARTDDTSVYLLYTEIPCVFGTRSFRLKNAYVRRGHRRRRRRRQRPCDDECDVHLPK